MTNYIRFEDNSQENIQNSWEKMVEEVQCSYLLPPDRKKICVDIGTNIGSFVYRAFDEGCFEQIMVSNQHFRHITLPLPS